MAAASHPDLPANAVRLYERREQVAVLIGISSDEVIADLEAGLRRGGFLTDDARLADAVEADRALTTAAHARGAALAADLYGTA